MEFDLRRKRTKSPEENKDRLSELPEHLIYHILSFLAMKDVIGTCVLSKKWRYIWSSVPCLNFPPTTMPIKNEIDFITRCLVLYKGLAIQKLNLSLKKSLKAGSHPVDWYIYFGLIHNVREFHLECMYKSFCNYTLHQQIFACTFLTVLELKYCNVNVPKVCKLDLLETLSLEGVDIGGGSFFDFTSSCPRLERVSLINCNVEASPGQSIKNVALKTLKICTSFYQTSDLEVYAPHLVTFESTITSLAKNICVFRGMQSLENASFVCSKNHWECRAFNNKILLAIDEMLDNVCHVKTLRLDSCYLEGMSIREKKGVLSSFDAEYLEIQTGLTRLEIPGLAYMFKCSPNVETLIINIEKISIVKLSRNLYYDRYSEEGGYWNDQVPIVFGMLEKLKIVRVYNFMKNLNAVPVKHEKNKIGEYVKKLRSDMDFLKFLLKNCKGLEKMIITTCVEVKPKIMKSRLTRILWQDLLAFPTATRDIEISIM